MNEYELKYGSKCPQENICAGVYDAIIIISEAMKENNNPEKIRDYIKDIDYEGVSGRIQFDSNNDRDNADYTLFRIQNKSSVKVE